MYGVSPFRPADSDKTPCPYYMPHSAKRSDVETLQADRGQPTYEQALISCGSGPPATRFKLIAKVQTSQSQEERRPRALGSNGFPFFLHFLGTRRGENWGSRVTRLRIAGRTYDASHGFPGFTKETSPVAVSANQDGPTDPWTPARFPLPCGIFGERHRLGGSVPPILATKDAIGLK